MYFKKILNCLYFTELDNVHHEEGLGMWNLIMGAAASSEEEDNDKRRQESVVEKSRDTSQPRGMQRASDGEKKYFQ